MVVMQAAVAAAAVVVLEALCGRRMVVVVVVVVVVVKAVVKAVVVVVEAHLCVERGDHFIRHQDRHDNVNEPQRDEQRRGCVFGTDISP